MTLQYGEQRMLPATYQAAGEEIVKEVKRKEKILRGYKTLNRIRNKLSSFGKKSVTFKPIVKKETRSTVVINQPVYTQDRSRFFKDEIEEDRRQLFFK